MKTGMKKGLSIVFVCALLLGLLGVISFAEPYSKSVALLGCLQDGLTETITHTADENGGLTISQSGWMPWVMYYTEESETFEANSGESLYLVYDFTVPADTDLQITLNGWNESVSAQIAGSNAGVAEGGAATILSGTYTGAIEVAASQIGENGRIGIAGTGITIREFKLASGAGTSSHSTTTTTKAGEVTTTTTKSAATSADTTSTTGTSPVKKLGNTLDLIDSIGNGTDETDETEIKDEGDGFLIQQPFGWNVWVLYYNEKAADFVAAAGEDLSLTYDFTVNGDAHICLNGWNNSVAAELAAKAGVSPVQGEEGAILLPSGTYTGTIQITPDTIGENGRFGIVGTGATIRTFRLVTTKSTVKKGDANGDDSVDMKDVLVIRREIAHLGDGNINAEAADVNGDDSVDMKDVLIIRKHIAGVERFEEDTTTTRSGTTGQTVATTTTQSTEPTTRRTTTTASGTPYLNYNTDTKNGSLGVWWWNSNTIIGANNYEKRLDFLQSNHVTEIYLCVGRVTYEQLGNFIKEAGKRGMRVAWLSGDASWIQSGNTGFDSFFSGFKAYQDQAAADEKFYGIHLDVEPYIGGGSTWQQPYSELVVRAGKIAHDYGTVIEWDIPFWLEGLKVTANSVSTDMLDVLAANADTLTLMSYRDTSAAVLDIASQEIPLSAKYNCRIILGLESNYTAEGANLSFGEDGKAAMYQVAETILATLATKGMTGGYGCAIHYIETWMNLKN